MNINDYRKAMDHISPSNELKERIMHKKTTHRRYAPVYRVLASTLTAILMLTCVTTVALAASPELRRAVLSFFRIEEREQVPGQTDINPSDINQPDVDQPYDNQPDISQTEIGSLVKAQYIKMDQRYGLSGGLLNNLTWSDDGRTLLEAEFWEIKDNNLVPVQVDMRTSQIDITFQDINYQGNLYWFIRNGELYYFQGSPYGVDTRPEDEWSVEAIPRHTDVLLLKLAQGQQTDYTEYPMLFYLDTGETEDFLASTGARELEYAYDYSWSENMRRALILCSAGMGGLQEWLCDLDARTLIRLDELTGMGEEVSAGFADNDTLILTTHTTSEEDETWQTITCYAYDIPTGQKTKTLDKAHYYRWWDEPYGAQLFGSRCVLIGEDGQVRLVDLKTGMQTVVEGFTWQMGDEFMPSPSGNKLLYYSSDSKAEGLGISQLGVVDLEKGTFIAFDREGYGNLYEEGIGWSNDSTVSINARSSDGETRYLILYTF
ncbi:hypothetical protein IMSAG249_00157 [Lachnospiraceae bacterium]|nr:hypothetical protein IMSAG249_00157 [Lachnospiraceae bacterium]